MFDPSSLSSVHGLDTLFPAGSEIACGNPLCSASFKPGGIAISPKRFCSDPCKQQASLLRRVAKILEALSDDQAIQILRRMR
jgi:hypothetical protein